jgi:flagellar L-ring protein precursor FlgH
MIAVVLTGCAAVEPSTKIKQPKTARPAQREQVVYNDGAIYHASSSRPLFEDRRARMVGDILTINIVEKTSANDKSSNSGEHSSSTSATTPAIPSLGSPAKLMFKSLTFGPGSSANKLANNSANATSNDFTGTLTVTVVEVLANGNLVVSGEKQIVVNQANEYIRFSGVVSPYTITGANTVQSTQVADAQLEYKGSNYSLDAASASTLLGRFFQSVLPF